MEAIQDFEDFLELLDRHRVRYLIIGGLAFIYHAKPRFTKNIATWLGSEPDDLARANDALAEFGSPYLLNVSDQDEILQLGVAPNRIDLLRTAAPLVFEDAWPRRVEGTYGRARACWVAIEDLLAIKERIDHPRHQEDARDLRLVLERRRTW
ncbi:MAG TPA: hypothetical protein VL691_18540 [Vicinamibacteria bacterium]|nr:hypothetical protein [Vicinamibacteria bacterium]